MRLRRSSPVSTSRSRASTGCSTSTRSPIGSRATGRSTGRRAQGARCGPSWPGSPTSRDGGRSPSTGWRWPRRPRRSVRRSGWWRSPPPAPATASRSTTPPWSGSPRRPTARPWPIASPPLVTHPVATCAVEPISYRPGTHCVLRYDLQAGPADGGRTVLFGKVYASGMATVAERLTELHRCGRLDGSFEVAGPLATAPELGLVVQPEAEGQSLGRRLFDPSASPRSRRLDAEAAGRALAGLHRCAGPAGPVGRWPTSSRTCAATAGLVAEADPALARRVDAVSTTCSGSRRPRSRRCPAMARSGPTMSSCTGRTSSSSTSTATGGASRHEMPATCSPTSAGGRCAIPAVSAAVTEVRSGFLAGYAEVGRARRRALRHQRSGLGDQDRGAPLPPAGRVGVGRRSGADRGGRPAPPRTRAGGDPMSATTARPAHHRPRGRHRPRSHDRADRTVADRPVVVTVGPRRGGRGGRPEAGPTGAAALPTGRSGRRPGRDPAGQALRRRGPSRAGARPHDPPRPRRVRRLARSRRPPGVGLERRSAARRVPTRARGRLRRHIGFGGRRGDPAGGRGGRRLAGWPASTGPGWSSIVASTSITRWRTRRSGRPRSPGPCPRWRAAAEAAVGVAAVGRRPACGSGPTCRSTRTSTISTWCSRPDRLAVVDLDEARLGDPALDVAHFVAYLELRAIRPCPAGGSPLRRGLPRPPTAPSPAGPPTSASPSSVGHTGSEDRQAAAVGSGLRPRPAGAEAERQARLVLEVRLGGAAS